MVLTGAPPRLHLKSSTFALAAQKRRLQCDYSQAHHNNKCHSNATICTGSHLAAGNAACAAVTIALPHLRTQLLGKNYACHAVAWQVPLAGRTRLQRRGGSPRQRLPDEYRSSLHLALWCTDPQYAWCNAGCGALAESDMHRSQQL